MTLMAVNTKNMRLGTCVTNPAVRDITVTSSLFATLNQISGGRMQLGIGRGDSSRPGAGVAHSAVGLPTQILSGQPSSSVGAH